jgi:tetratricopeptide (TPR) repeat protein
MKRAIGFIVVVVALLGACASAPETVQPPDDAYDTAKSLRSQIQEFDLAQYAQSDFDAGETQFAAAEVAYGTEEYATAEEGFSLAIDSYTKVIREGLSAILRSRREEATAQKELADEMKASVAVADNYATALEVYNEAIAAAEAGDDQEAAELFENAAVLFAQVYEQATEKRRQALEAMGRVDQRVQDLDLQRGTLEGEAREDLETDDSTEEDN